MQPDSCLYMRDFRLSTGCRAGVERSEVELRFENLSVSVEVLLGQQARQTLLNYYKNGVTVSHSIPSMG